jgi:cellulose synthase/poly-beta-1,6-N-acetylglucosamine synthase-like glycosyltransferase
MASAIFLLSTAFVLYVLFCYPVLLAWLAKRRSRPFRKQFEAKTASMLLPVRNGERWLASKLDSILALDYPQELLEVIILSDGSADRTAAIAREYVGRGRVALVELPRGGKAAALNEGLARASGEILFLTDVRQPLAPDSLRNLVACFADPSVGVVSGELVILEGATHEEVNVGLYWKYEKWIRKNLSATGSIAGATGAIYAMRRNLARPMPADTLVDDMHLPLGAYFQGYRVVLEESAKAYDYPTSLDTEFRRKVRTLAGVYQAIGTFPGLLNPANGIWVHFVSHKLGRLLLPFALIAILCSSFYLPAPWPMATLAGQAILYGVALADLIIPERSSLKRLSTPVRTFVVLMGAALAAASIWFLPAKRFWAPPGAVTNN